VENIDFSFHRERAEAELEAAYRSTEPEETERHLRLALFHLKWRRDHRFERTRAPSPSACPPIWHTDKEG